MKKLEQAEAYRKKIETALEAALPAPVPGDRAGKVTEAMRYSLLAGKLDALSPLKVLARGYAVVYDGRGGIVRDAGRLAPGEVVTIRAAEGEARAKVVERSERSGGKTQTEI